MTASAVGLLLALSAASQVIYSSPGGNFAGSNIVVSNIAGKELQEQKDVYKQLWDADLIVRLDDLRNRLGSRLSHPLFRSRLSRQDRRHAGRHGQVRQGLLSRPEPGLS